MLFVFVEVRKNSLEEICNYSYNPCNDIFFYIIFTNDIDKCCMIAIRHKTFKKLGKIFLRKVFFIWNVIELKYGRVHALIVLKWAVSQIMEDVGSEFLWGGEK